MAKLRKVKNCKRSSQCKRTKILSVSKIVNRWKSLSYYWSYDWININKIALKSEINIKMHSRPDIWGKKSLSYYWSCDWINVTTILLTKVRN